MAITEKGIEALKIISETFPQEKFTVKMLNEKSKQHFFPATLLNLVNNGYLTKSNDTPIVYEFTNKPLIIQENKENKKERQKHGFIFEKRVAELFNIDIDNKKYTDKWDGVLNGYPVSIKTKENGRDIEMADFKRNAENTESFYLIVGFWETEKENIVKIETLFIDGQEWHALFPEHFINDFSDLLQNITNDKEDDEKWSILTTELKNKWEQETENLIRPRFKRDHKKQKRVQCAINYNDFYNYFIPKYKKEIV